MTTPLVPPPIPAITFNIGIMLDRNEDGTIRKTRNGYYRFTLCFKDSTGATCATIRGFRVAPPFMRLQCPMSQWRETIYTFIEMRSDLEAAIIAAVQAEIASNAPPMQPQEERKGELI